MEVLIIDGGLSTELIRLGFPVTGDPLWTSRYLVTNPSALKRAHLSFLENGADIILTGTYQASQDLFQKEAGIEKDEFCKLVQKACQLAREAANEIEKECKNGRRRPMVAGSVSPYGACLCDMSEYHGRYADSMTTQELSAWHRPRIQALVEGNVDLLAIETIPSIKEAESVIAVLEEFPEMKAWMTFQCKDKIHIGHGETFAEAVAIAARCPQVIAVGTNCIPAENVTALLQSATSARNGKPFVVYPNAHAEQWAGIDGICGEKTVYDMDTLIPEWIEAGARYIGGCCGIDSLQLNHISQIVRETIK